MSDGMGNIKFGVGGRVVRIDVLENGKVVNSLKGFKNLILNSGLDSLGVRSLAGSFTACAVGTGNTIPANTDTQLIAEVARTSTYLTGAGNCGTTRNSATKLTHRRTFDFPIEGANRVYTELGFSWSPTINATLFSRVLIKSGGSPVALTVLIGQQLRVVYEAYIDFSTSVGNWNLNFGGTWGATAGTSALQNTNNAGYTPIKVMGVDGVTIENQFYADWGLEPTDTVESLTVCSSNQALAATGLNNARTAIDSVPLVPQAYTPGNFYRDKIASFTTNQGNGVIQSLTFLRSNSWAALFAAPRTKDNTATLSFTLRFSWNRI